MHTVGGAYFCLLGGVPTRGEGMCLMKVAATAVVGTHPTEMHSCVSTNLTSGVSNKFASNHKYLIHSTY